MIKHLVSIISFAIMLPLLGSHLGAIHPLGDSLAVFRGPLVVAGLAAVLVLTGQRRWWATVGAGALVLSSAYTVLAPRLQYSAALDAPYSLYQKNMSFRMPETGPITQDILGQSPDFLTLQEVAQNNLSLLANLKESHPAQAVCPFAGVGAVAVASRWPLIEGSKRCQSGYGMVAMQVETPDGPVWVVALHLHWAYPFGQAAQVGQMRAGLQALEGPVVLGGDFNMVPWSHTMRIITSDTHTRRIGAPKYTFSLFNGLYSLPIDHVLVNGNNRPSETWKRPKLGSDHSGVLARFFIR